MQEGFDGLLRDKTRPSRIAPLGPDVADRVVALTPTDPPAEATHWTAAMMAGKTGISVSRQGGMIFAAIVVRSHGWPLPPRLGPLHQRESGPFLGGTDASTVYSGAPIAYERTRTPYRVRTCWNTGFRHAKNIRLYMAGVPRHLSFAALGTWR